MNAFMQHFSFEFRTGIRNRSLLFMTYLFPLLVYVLLGALMTAVNPLFRETMIPAMLIFAVLSGTLLSLPSALVTARSAGIFRSYKINGVPAISILVIPALSILLHLVLITIIITSTAPIAFNAPLPVNWLGFGAVFALIVASCAGLSLLIGVISSTAQMTMLLGQIFFLPSMLLGGLMLPTSILPDALRKIAMLLPTTYAMNAFRGLAQGLPTDYNPVWSVVVLLASAVLAFGLAIYLFNWDSNDTSQSKRLPLALIAMLPFVVAMLLLE
jgi:ABC-2 type transport system permease protein